MKYLSSLVPKLIYVFRINDNAHAGCLKVGEATYSGEQSIQSLQPCCSELNKAAKARINSYTQTAGIAYDLLYTELTIYFSGKQVCAFNDKAVHEVLKRSGIQQKVFNIEKKADEWFITDLETIKKAIVAVKESRQSLNAAEVTTNLSPIIFRPEQRDAIDKTKKQFKKNNQMLWNAKMRFGKTLSALQVVKELEFQRTLILTHRPVVNKQWHDDFNKIFYDRQDFSYGSKTIGEHFDYLEKSAKKKGLHYVFFVSLQDLRGSERTGGKFDKNDEIFDADWDLIIVDEAHEGTLTELGKNVLNELKKKSPKELHLSGTPFNLLDDYKEAEIYTWDYTMEQRAKQEWDLLHFGDPNPYASLPRMNIYTFDLGKKFSEFADSELAFNFREFFRVDDNGTFVHKKDIAAFLNLICKKDDASNYPYSTEENRENFRHSLWKIPGVKEAKALSALLQAHPVFGQFRIVNVAGDGDEDVENEEALKMVRTAIASNDYTITLSCGRLTTGVSVPEWTAVFMLAGTYSTSAASYMQTIFRVQTPATINGKVKEECFVFDFAPDRTLKVLAETAKISAKAGKTTGTDRQTMQEFLNFCPVIAFDGTQMKTYNVDRMLAQLKRVYVERVIQHGFDDGNLYNNDMMLKLTGKDLSEFAELKGIIGTTKAMPKSGEIDINNQGFTDEQYDDLSEAEKGKRKKENLTPEQQKLLEKKKEQQKQRESAISVLRGISIRMPLMIYGAELQDENQEITLDNFAELIDQQSWIEFMPKGVTKQHFNSFKKYYEPDVFRSAGKRIREMAKAADALPLDERIERITTIFGYFRNPDKETVLTPWRVVNLHLSDCIGGYTFFDEKFEHPAMPPRFVDLGKITQEVFAPKTQILEINSKSGLYPLYAAYSVYKARQHGRKNLSIEEQYALWKTVLAENIFVICKTPMAKSITKRTLLGFRRSKVNAHYFEDLVNMLKNNPNKFIEKVSKRNYWDLKGNTPMHFDAIIGNPPYQEETAKQQSQTNGQAPRASIFQYFQMAADALSSGVTSLIYPGTRWIHRAGKGMGQFGLQQINDPKLSRLDFYPDSQDIFKEVAIADGLSIVLKKAQKTTRGFTYVYHKSGNVQSVHMDNPGEMLITLNPQNEIVLQKIEAGVSAYKLSYLHNRILPRNLFGIESNFVENNPTLVREYSKGESFNPLKEIKLFTNNKAGKSGRAQWYIANLDVIAPDSKKYIKEWQVVVSSANAGGQKRDNQISIIDNHSAFGRARVALGSFKTQEEAKNFFAYAQSKLIRFLFLMTDESLTSLGKKVPDFNDYSNKNEILDFAKDIDEQLYHFFDLSEEEISFVEANIKDHAVSGNLYYSHSKLCKATMEIRNGEYVILEDSVGRIELTPTGKDFSSIVSRRKQCVEQGITEERDGKLIFLKEYSAKSPSEAANLLLGSTINGNVFWKDANGNPLKEKK